MDGLPDWEDGKSDRLGSGVKSVAFYIKMIKNRK